MKRRGLPTPSLSRTKTYKTLLKHWQPHPGPQTAFLLSPAFELLYGGAAGGGKSVGLLADCGSYVHLKEYAGILFRKTYKQLGEAGGLRDRSDEIYPHLGGRFLRGEWRWNFPSGSQIALRHLQHAADKDAYQGAEYGYIGFDQLEQFREVEYLYLFSRARSRDPRIESKIRATANPGSEWVLRRWLPWLGTDEELEAAGWPRAKSGELLWFKRDGDKDILTEEGDPDALSRTFIPATVYDNPTLMENDPKYIVRLKALPYVDRRRLLDSDWHIKDVGGLLFQRIWFDKLLERRPHLDRIVRGFDLAATEKEQKSSDPDFTATFLEGKVTWADKSEHYLVLDAEQERLSPGSVKTWIKNFHDTDPLSIEYVFEQEPGASAKIVLNDIRQMLRGRRMYTIKVSKDKVERSGPTSSDLEGGLISFVKGSYLAPLINHAVNFPSSEWHDDLIDGWNLCHQTLTVGAPELPEDQPEQESKFSDHDISKQGSRWKY